MKLTITISRDLIRKGKREDCRTCPVALGMKAAGFTAVRVWPDTMTFRYNGFQYDIAVPYKVQQFIQRFDDGFVSLSPFSFTLTL